MAFPTASAAAGQTRHTTRAVKKNLLRLARQAAAPYQARHGDQRMFPRMPMTVGRGSRDANVTSAGSRRGGLIRQGFMPSVIQAWPLDNDDVLGLMQLAGSLGVAGHVTERVGGRPHQDARLVRLFDPRLENGRPVGGID